MNVSVVIPALNEEKYIGKCLKATIKQLEPGDEVIVVDNGSTDKTAEIAKKYGAKVVKEAKRGISYARNRGAREAKGKVLVFFDADGIPNKRWIAKAKKTLANPEVQAVSGFSIFAHKNKFKFIWYNVYSVSAHVGLFFMNLAGKLFLSCNNVAIRKDIFWKLGGYEPVMGEDYWLSKKFWQQKQKKGVFHPLMIMSLSSRGFDETGYLRTLHYWTVTALKRRSQEGYNYKNKIKSPRASN